MRLIWILVALLCVGGCATPRNHPAAASSTEARIKATLNERFPASPIEKVRPSPYPGWYEIVTPTELVYTDAEANLLFVGKVIDTKTKVDLTSRRLSEAHAIDFGTLPLAKAIKRVKGNGSRTVAIFEDPNCPYCRQLEHNLEPVTDVTIYTFLYPLEELHPGATARAHTIWCASDRASAWTKWMQENVEPPKAECTETNTAELQSLGNSLNIVGTPMTFFADGHRVEGVIDTPAMERQLSENVTVVKR